jgi:hypothetical protein
MDVLDDNFMFHVYSVSETMTSIKEVEFIVFCYC